MENIVTYVGIDTHKKTHKLAVCYPSAGEIVEFSINNTVGDIKSVVKKIMKQAPGEVRFCYEAGVCGFTLKRKIESFGCKCEVIAPSLTPIKPGDRIKTDRRDAIKLCMMFASGLLTEVFAPNAQQEADRELVRLRATAKEHLKATRHQIDKFLTRNGYVYKEGNNWTQKHLRWLSELKFEVTSLKSILHHYLDEMVHCINRVEMLDTEVEQLAQTQQYKERVGVLRCYVGIDTLTAMSIILEIFNFQRFDSPRSLMSYLGLTPSESSSGGKISKGSITKAGNKFIRRLLNETAWHYRHAYLPSKKLKERRTGQPQWAIDIADKAAVRLTRRRRYLIEKGKAVCKVNIAIARELIGFIWATMSEYEARCGI
jgi:transposase